MPWDQASYKAPKHKAKKKVAKKKVAKKAKKKVAPKRKAAKEKVAKKRASSKAGYPPEEKGRRCSWCRKPAREQDPTVCTRKTCRPRATRCKAKHPVTKYRCVEHHKHVWNHAYHADQDEIGNRWWWNSKTDLRRPE
jgi:hypothetical protein